ncbi:MAG TPA: hypothetical protein ENJ39_05405 [Flammeovirgaceae bacterium]|nr:hypothetical protein [Flammeovirgaceae bacterium]
MSIATRINIERTLNKPFYAVLILLFLTLFVYYPVLNAHLLHFDDLGMVQELSNPYQPPSIRSFFLSGTHSRYYRPLLLSSFVLDHDIWQQEAAGYHLTNYLLHAANVLLLYFILSQLAAQFNFAGRLLPLGGSLLFALHPLTCESVAWVSGRTDILAAFFSLSAFLFYLHKSRTGTTICLLLGLLSKESALSIIPVIALSDFWIRRWEGQQIKQAIFSSLSWIATMSVSLLIYLYMRTGGIFSLDTGVKEALTNKVIMAKSTDNISYYLSAATDYCSRLLSASSFYIKKLFVPFPLNFAIYKINERIYLLSATLILLSIAYMTLKKKTAMLGWTALLVAGFAPGLLVATSKIAWMPFAERYLYLSCAIWAAFMIFAGQWLITHFANGKRVAAFLFTVLILLWGTTTSLRALTWHDDFRLWTAAYKSSPDSGKIMYKYGVALTGKGRKKAGLKMIKESLKTIKDDKWRAYALITLGNQAISVHDFIRAGKRYQEALKAQNGYFEQAALASFYAQLPALSPKDIKTNIDKAVRHYIAAYKLKNKPNFLFQAARLLAKNNRDAAQSLYQEIIEKHPTSQEAVFARQTLHYLGQQHGI